MARNTRSVRHLVTPFCLILVLAATGLCAQNRLPTGRDITPRGQSVAVGSFPANIQMSPDGRFLAVTNTGYRQYLSILSTVDGHIVSQLSVNGTRNGRKQGLYYGLAFVPAPGGYRLYASRGTEGKIEIYSVSAEGELTDTGQALAEPPSPKEHPWPTDVAGIAAASDGSTLYAANNLTTAATRLKGALTIFPAGAEPRRVELPGFPFAVAAPTRGPAAGRKVYVTSERDAVVSVVDPAAARLLRNIQVGKHPMALTLDAAQQRLYVANAGSDTISVIDTASDRVVQTILLRPAEARGLPGCTPTAVCLAPDGSTLYATLADMNAVAVVALPQGSLQGYIPVGWYPTAVAVSPDGSRLFVANAKGVQARNPNHTNVGRWGRYIENIIEGCVSVMDVPGRDELARLTAQTLANNAGSTLASRAAPDLPKGIRHVIYIIKENRTYDQVLGDLKEGNGDPSLCLFPRDVTPNQHALAERFVLLDNFYCPAEVSADGWVWSTAGMASEYTERNTPYNYSGRGREYDFEGQNNGVPVDLLGLTDVAAPATGYIWDAVAKKGLSYRNYGFYLSFAGPGDRGPDGRPIAIYNTPNKKTLVGHTDLDFLQFDMGYADSEVYQKLDLPPPPRKTYGSHHSPSRFTEWKREFDEQVRRRSMPAFTMLRLPRDHTAGTSAGLHTPRAMVADNDYAVGQVVEAVSHSPFWKETAIFIVEDDAQNGNDHVDAHRSPCYVISPYVKRSSVDHTFYNTDSVLRTMELLLGLPPLTQYDAGATVFTCFTDRPENDEPFTAILPAKEIAGEINRKSAYKADVSARLNFAQADGVPDDLLTEIVWHSVKGSETPMPPIVRSGSFTVPKGMAEDAPPSARSGD
ncbi:MAG: alkaline phosphatase family protein [Chthonomonadales bacterium]